MIEDNMIAYHVDERFQIFPIGIIHKPKKTVAIEIFEKYTSGLLGLNQFSHIIVCFWFHQNDEIEKRHRLKVHPRGNRENPLTGVFATRSPMRPNLIGMSMCKVLSIKGNFIYIDQIDAFNQSPVLDLKPYIPAIDSIPEASVPEWVGK